MHPCAFLCFRISISVNRAMQWLASIADIVRQQSGGAKKLVSIPISGEALHRVKELPYTKRQQSAIALFSVFVIGVELSPEINIDFVVVCKTLRAECLLVRAMFVDVSIMRRMFRAGTAMGTRLNVATSCHFVRKLFPNLIGHIRQRHQRLFLTRRLESSLDVLLVKVRKTETDSIDIVGHELFELPVRQRLTRK